MWPRLEIIASDDYDMEVWTFNDVNFALNTKWHKFYKENMHGVLSLSATLAINPESLYSGIEPAPCLIRR